MKDYLVEQKGKFILGYVVDEDKITIIYADGSKIKRSISENKEIVESLNHVMENQIMELDNEDKGIELNSKLSDKFTRNIIEAVGLGAFTIGSIMVLPVSVAIPLSTVFLGRITYNTIKYSNLKKVKNDFDKNVLFVNNKKEINEELSNQSNENLELNLNRKNKELLADNFCKLNINSVEYTKLNELKDLVNYLEKSKELDELINKPKVLRKERITKDNN